MSKIAILTDSSCDIPQEMAEKYGIDIMGFHILLDDVELCGAGELHQHRVLRQDASGQGGALHRRHHAHPVL